MPFRFLSYVAELLNNFIKNKHKLDSEEKFSGISNEKVQATVTSEETSPKVIFNTSDGAINFSVSGNGSR